MTSYQLLDAIYERLVSSLSIEGTYIVQEDDPVNEMLFVISWQLDFTESSENPLDFAANIGTIPGMDC